MSFRIVTETNLDSLSTDCFALILPEDVDDGQDCVSVRCLGTVQSTCTYLGPHMATILVNHSEVVGQNLTLH